MAYAAPIWHAPTSSQRAKGPAAKLASTQNKCLRLIAGAYKATPVRALETETFIPPLDLYLDGRAAAYQERIEGSKVESVIQEACKWIKRRKWCRRRREGTGDQTGAYPTQRARWASQRKEDLGPEKTGPQMVQEAWSRRWASQVRPPGWDVVVGAPSKEVLKLHINLRKAESSALIQIRTGRTGLAACLYILHVPDVDSPWCRCGRGKETPRHLIVICELEEDRRGGIANGQGNTLSFLQLTTDPKLVGATARWYMRSGRIAQFALAIKLHDEEDKEDREEERVS
jgi:hypothetical protein